MGGHRLARSGWLPACAVLALTVGLLCGAARVSLPDLALVGAYLALWLVLPGTLAWRAIDRSTEPRPLLEDLALGALVGIVLEAPVYLACLAAGVPRLHLLWPVVVVALSLATRRTRSSWTRPTAPLAPGVSWAIAAVVAFQALWFGRHVWARTPVTPRHLLTPYVDEPYHLSLVASLRHHFPPETTYVAGTPLDYHWLSHLHVAAASWVSGVEPVVLLRSVTLPVTFLVVTAATAAVAMRLTGSAWTGPVAAAATLAAPFSVHGWRADAGSGLLGTLLVRSPSAGFVTATLLLALLLTVEQLTGRRRDVASRALLAVTFLAVAGTKSTALPPLAAGLLAATIVVSLHRRRLHRESALLAGLAVGAMLVAKVVFFGPGTHGLVVAPLAVLERLGGSFPGLLDATGQLPPLVAVLATLTLAGLLTLGAPASMLLLRGGWHEPAPVFLVVTPVAGVGATLTFHQAGYSEVYFTHSVLLPLALAAVLGLHRLAGWAADRGISRAAGVRGAALVVGVSALVWVLLGLLLPRLGPSRPTGAPVEQAVQLFVLPTVLVLGVAAALAGALAVLLIRRAPTGTPRAAVALPTAVLVLAAWGACGLVESVPRIVADPVPRAASAPARPLIGPGGVDAARWLREHSQVGDLVATNAHCETPGTRRCTARHFWMAGHTERRFLIEGWSYVSRSTVGLPAPRAENTIRGAFWDPARLYDNDLAFLAPTEAAVATLREEYGVDWLLVDTAYPVDLGELSRHATPVHGDGRYVVLTLE